MKNLKNYTRKSLALLLLVLTITAMFPFGAQAESRRALNTPPQREKLPELIDKFVLERESGIAGLSISVLNKEGLIYSKQFGYEDIENQIKIDEKSVFEWGSVSKLLVWISFFQLEEKGLLDLNKDIRTYLPKDFLTKLEYPNEKITLLDLMNHTAGFQEVQYNLETTTSADILSLEEALKYYEPRQIYRPGAVVSYSNWGAGLGAFIVECVSGQRFDNYVLENIFNPLGMGHTSIRADFSDNAWVKRKRAKMKSYMIMERTQESYGDSISFIQLYPAGSATGTMEDFVKFGQALISYDSPLFNKVETRGKFLSPSRYYEGSEIPRIYHGLWVLPYGSGIVGHSGNTKGYTSSLYFDIESNRLVLVMTNEVGETAFNYGMQGLIFGDYEEGLGSLKEGKDISGIYTSYRANIPKGYGKLYSYIGGLLPLKKGEEPNTFNMAVGQGYVKQISDNFFIMDNHNGLKVLKNLKEVNGRQVFESFTGDEVKEHTFSFIARIVLFVGFLLGGLICLIWILIDVIWFVIAKISKRAMKIKRFSMIAKALNLGLVFLVIILLFSDLFTSLAQARPLIFGIIILGLGLFYAGIRMLKEEGKSKWFLAAIFTVSVLNVLYWQWFNFWI